MKKNACKNDCLKTARDHLNYAAVWLDRAAMKAHSQKQPDCVDIVEARKAIHRIIEAMADRYPVGKLNKSQRIWTETV